LHASAVGAVVRWVLRVALGRVEMPVVWARGGDSAGWPIRTSVHSEEPPLPREPTSSMPRFRSVASSGRVRRERGLPGVPPDLRSIGRPTDVAHAGRRERLPRRRVLDRRCETAGGRATVTSLASRLPLGHRVLVCPRGLSSASTSTTRTPDPSRSAPARRSCVAVACSKASRARASRNTSAMTGFSFPPSTNALI